jgi:hypothetical protein
MTTVILLTLEDINCTSMGEHFEITTKEGLKINLTPEAALELQDDIMKWHTLDRQ